jgi:hypothetical protein
MVLGMVQLTMVQARVRGKAELNLHEEMKNIKTEVTNSKRTTYLLGQEIQGLGWQTEQGTEQEMEQGKAELNLHEEMKKIETDIMITNSKRITYLLEQEIQGSGWQTELGMEQGMEQETTEQETKETVQETVRLDHR